MSVLLNPRHSVTYDAGRDLVVVALRDGRDASIVEIDPDQVPAFVNALMESRRQAKIARKAVKLPPPMVRPTLRPVPTSPADRVGVRLLDGRRRP